MMTTVHTTPTSVVAYVKGAPEIVLERCGSIQKEDGVSPLTEAWRERILSANEGMAGDALRVLALAYRPLEDLTSSEPEADTVERELIFVGLVGMIDPPRAEAIEAVKQARKVGMKVIMITGDHKLTALAIARDMGIFQESDTALTGEELEKMGDEEFERQVDRATVYARVSPVHKL